MANTKDSQLERLCKFILRNWWKYLIGFVLALYLDAVSIVILKSWGIYSVYELPTNPFAIAVYIISSLIGNALLLPAFLYAVIGEHFARSTRDIALSFELPLLAFIPVLILSMLAIFLLFKFIKSFRK